MTDELIGKTIGGYEILSRIGQGGMATVFLARQNSMNRQVALKVLPLHFMTDDTYLQRFEREVKIVSQLEHRNIVPVYDYGEHEGQPYIVMRYMPAGSVDDILQRGAMPLDQVKSIVNQIAPALDYAHSKEVLHRDLKPSNVLMDDGGGAFLTDFGIARIASEQASGITTQGVVGTPSYMSPEQAQGKDIDGRSDVYSLGVMLFEMATGRRPFEADTPYSIAVMQVTTNPPAPRAYNPDIPGSVERVILKSLKKSPDDRYQNAVELSQALEMAIERPDSVYDTEPSNRPAPQQQTAPPVYTPPPPQQPTVEPQSAPHFQQGNSSRMRPYTANISQRIKQRRNSGALVSLLLGGTIGCGLLLVLSVALFLGLNALGVFQTSQNRVPTRNPNNIITPTFDEIQNDAVATLDARHATQTTVALETLEAIATDDGFAPVGVREQPTLLPSLQDVPLRILFMDRRGEEDNRSFEIVWVNLRTWVETQPTFDNSDNLYPQVSPDGRWLVFQSDRDGDFDIFVTNLGGGGLRRITDNNYDDHIPSWSPDGDWILYSSDVRSDGTLDLYRTNFESGETELVYSNAQRKSHARYSPDGRYIVFAAGDNPNDSRTWDIARLDTTTNRVELLTENDVRDAVPVYTPDGESIIFSRNESGTDAIFIMDANGDNQRVLYDSDSNDRFASVSPDGQYVVVTSDQGGEDQLYLMTIDGGSAQQITYTGGAYGSWLR